MSLLTTALLGLALVQDADRIETLVRDLGAADFAAREKADAELRAIGAPARAALEKAARDPDPERSYRARKILEDLDAPKAKPKAVPGSSQSTLTIMVSDVNREFTLEKKADGSVVLTVRREDGEKVDRVYEAESMEAFREKHPEVAKKFDVEGFGARPRAFGRLPGRERFRGFGGPVPPEFEDFLKGFEERFRGRLRPFGLPREGRLPGERLPAPRGPELGILVNALDPVLADQLDLPEGQGCTIEEVKPGSEAERAGLEKYDVIVAIAGEPVTDLDAFGRSVRERLTVREPFELTVIRRGKQQTIKVTPLQ